ncbi:Bsc6p KNAG_0A01240 [Huiozyma naganishii CBS 8797]|uniref:Major facilitator superfamily (MFS) profile domain-containing protein n=1 Tax=Huiozyma naganishii (strain ATCC MYA-139 / BCRC 22969 / CBS 8797 / KCTC 17520 / NBRC 10181 / NCYC 3082 / Yp74L-3) TaxID=1071383 RepID=J7RE25_HUIN7|nr:hypothetical protein KNAG_0A01240 [Kazachstania naganishii CBS 8797]CCK67813.1 hypothetical protein KNAG_0A01240 [Kazachstania naganishii CBS 8797]
MTHDRDTIELGDVSVDSPTVSTNAETSLGDPEITVTSESPDTALVRDVEWKGDIVTVFPLDYQKVPMVKYQIISCLMLFMVFGFNDQSTGALLPTLQEYYNASAIKVSNIFLVQLAGYTTASFCNEFVHRKFGTRGGIYLSVLLCTIPFLILVWKPKRLGVYVTCSFPLGLAIGILDATGNVLIGNLLVHKNEWMGILHATYGVAAMVTPPFVSYFVQWGHWSLFFLVPLVVAILALFLSIPSFKYETAVKYDYICNKDENLDDSTNSGNRESFIELMKQPPIFLYATFLFFYLGAEITTGAWFFSFLLETKLDDKIKMSYVAAAFWLGLTFGRFILGFVTKRAFVNEYRAAKTYTLLTLFFYTIFVFVGHISSHTLGYFVLLFITIFCCGFFIGPLFPSASIVAIQVLPARLHVTGVSIAVAFGGCGGAVLPYLAGAVIHWLGIKCMPFLSWLFVTFFSVVWLAYPRLIKGHEEFL